MLNFDLKQYKVFINNNNNNNKFKTKTNLYFCMYYKY